MLGEGLHRGREVKGQGGSSVVVITNCNDFPNERKVDHWGKNRTVLDEMKSILRMQKVHVREELQFKVIWGQDFYDISHNEQITSTFINK